MENQESMLIVMSNDAIALPGPPNISAIHSLVVFLSWTDSLPMAIAKTVNRALPTRQLHTAGMKRAFAQFKSN